MGEKKKARKIGGSMRIRPKPADKEANSDQARGNSQDWFRDRAERVDRLLRSVEQKLEDSELRASVGDYIRLLQLLKELEEERPREITVRWVEPSETEDVSVA